MNDMLMVINKYTMVVGMMKNGDGDNIIVRVMMIVMGDGDSNGMIMMLMVMVVVMMMMMMSYSSDGDDHCVSIVWMLSKISKINFKNIDRDMIHYSITI